VTDEGEIHLHGGRTTPEVVRVGDTVRRPPTPNSDFVARLLVHLAATGFDAAPRHLGSDAQGRDVFSYLDGDVPAELGHHDDRTLAQSARLIRRYHDATAPLLDSPAARAAGMEVVCHNDLSPCNFVFGSDGPKALIDFDVAAPGTRLFDLAYAAWLWLDLGSECADASEQRRRLSLFVAAYGASVGPAEIAQAITVRQRIIIAQGERIGDRAMSTWAQTSLAWAEANLC
jgi:Ser/Thr protein kinase RdoA (MazF antagonist)